MIKNKYSTNITLDKNNSLTYIINKIDSGSTVLEFGPATGYMTRYLKEEKNCSVYIVEVDESAFKEAVKYAVDGFCGDAETGTWYEQFIGIKFDFITFADVLEHLRDPLNVLKKAKKLLKEDSGEILTSIPNIAHNAVLVDLYNNKFQYRNTGIMDNTHLRFFTHNSMVSMFREAELYPVDEDQVVFSLEYAGFNNKATDVPDSVWAALSLRKHGYVNQFLFTLSTKESVCVYHDDPIDEEECPVYYSNGFEYDEEHKSVDFVRISEDRFQIDWRFGDSVDVRRLMLNVMPFPCCIGNLKLSLSEDMVESIIPDNGFMSGEDGSKYLFIGNTARIEVCLKDTSQISNLSITGQLFPITFVELEECFDKRQSEYKAKLENLYCILEKKEVLLQQTGAEIQRLNDVLAEKEIIIAKMSDNQEEKRLNQVVDEKLRIIHEMSAEIRRLNAVIEEKEKVIAVLQNNHEGGNGK